MPSRTLHLSFFGSFQANIDDVPLDNFRTDSTRALLAYLAMHPGDGLHRSFLASLLWPDSSADAAAANLRQSLYRLRQALSDPSEQDDSSLPFVIATRQTISFNSGSPYQIDAQVFTTLLDTCAAHPHRQLESCPDCMARLQTAINVYTGDFLAGLNLPNASGFNEWRTLIQERFHAQAMQTLDSLSAYYIRRRDYGQAAQALRHLLNVEPWREEDHRRLLRVLALDGQVESALVHYANLSNILFHELGEGPAPETHALAQRLRAGEDLTDPFSSHNPYKGLNAFETVDASDYFGRHREVDRLHRLVRNAPLAALIGPSGSGKSSLVAAGLIPTLLTDLPDPDEQDRQPWRIVQMHPGQDPILNLATALIPYLPRQLNAVTGRPHTEAGQLATLLADLETDRVNLADLVDTVLAKSPAAQRLLLVVDQFEEIYTLCADPSVRDRLIHLLLPQPRSPGLTVLIVLRADFTSQALEHPELAAAIQIGGTVLGPMTEADIRLAIEEPAQLQGVALEPGLTERLIVDMGTGAGRLPLLEFALSQLWQISTGSDMTHQGYEAIGGIQGALTAHAEETLATFPPADQGDVRTLFTRLVRPNLSGPETRHRLTRSDLGNDKWRLAQRLADARLLVTNRNEHGGETVEITHEMLIQTWPRLRQWLAEDRTFRLWQTRLRAALEQWINADRDNGALLQGVLLAEAEARAAEQIDALSAEEIGFIQTSVDRREAGVRAKAQQQRREQEMTQALAAESQARADQQSRAAQRLRLLSFGLMGLLAVAIALGALALRQTNVANRASDIARSLNLASAAELALSQKNTDLARILAVEAVKIPDPPPSVARTLAHVAYTPGARLRILGHDAPILRVAFLPDGDTLLSAAEDGTVRLWNRADGAAIRSMTPAATPLADLAITQEGNAALGLTSAGALLRWDLQTGDLTFITQPHEGSGCCLALLPNGDQLITAGDDGILALWADGGTRQVARWTAPGGAITALAVSPDGRTAISAQADHSLALWDLAQIERGPRLLIPGAAGVTDAYSPEGTFLEVHYGRISAIAFLVDGERFVTTAQDERIMLWDTASGDLLAHYDPNIDMLDLAVLTPDSIHANDPDRPIGVVGTIDNRILAYDLESGELVGELLGHATRVETVAVNGEQILSGGTDGSLRLWDLDNGAQIRIVDRNVWGYASMALSPDGSRLLAGLWDGRIVQVDTETGAEMCTLTGHTSMVFGGIRFLPDGRRAVSAGGDLISFAPTATVHLWDLDTCTQLAVLDEGRLPIWDLDVSRDGRIAVYGTHEGVFLWDLTSPTSRMLTSLLPQNVRSVTFAPDGGSVWVGPGKGTSPQPVYDLLRVDVESGEILERLPGNREAVTDLAFSPDGARLASTSLSKEVLVWDMENQTLRHRLTGHLSGLLVATFSPDGRLLATGDQAAMIIVWDVETGDALRSYQGPKEPLYDIAFAPNSTFFYATGEDETVRAWRLDRDIDTLLAWIGTNRYVPEITCEQRAQYLITPLCEE